MLVALGREVQKAAEMIDELFDREPDLRIGRKRSDRLIQVPRHIVGTPGTIVKKTTEAIARRELRERSCHRHHVGRVWHRHDCCHTRVTSGFRKAPERMLAG
jgi:hypothetical protein